MAETLESIPPRFERLPYEKAERGFLPDEIAVQFSIGGKSFVTFVPSNFVDTKRQALVVQVVGLWEDGSFLVELPSETSAGGSKLRVPPDVLIGE